MTQQPLFAPDTNMLTHETSRRMLHGIALETGFGVAVLPEVQIEMRRRLARLEENRWMQRLAADERYTDATKKRIVTAAGRAASEWFESEMVAQDNAYVQLSETYKQGWVARRLADTLPQHGVVRKDTDTTQGDPLIVAQAVVHGVVLLSSNNLITIEHDVANEWAIRETSRTTQLIYSPDQTLEMLSQNTNSSLYMWTIAYGMRHQGVADSVYPREYMLGLQRLEGAGFHKTACLARWEYQNNVATFMQSVDLARQYLGDDRTALSETQRSAQVRNAAAEAGWSPTM